MKAALFPTQNRALRRIAAVLVLILGGLGVPTSAQALLLQSAPTLRQGVVAFGGFGMLTFEPSEFTAIGQVAYGLAQHVQIEGRLGFGTIDVYAGGFLKYFLTSGKVADVALWAGLSTLGSSQLEAAAHFSRGFDSGWGLYLSPRLALPLSGGGDAGLSLQPGFFLPLKGDLTFYGELTLDLANQANAATFGVRTFL
ncbi:MAG: hypothetical protein IT285_12310 [Bdellovibrionales bacterium]|nr:hypothetical protein [Bdellovibrionales bacterium]